MSLRSPGLLSSLLRPICLCACDDLRRIQSSLLEPEQCQSRQALGPVLHLSETSGDSCAVISGRSCSLLYNCVNLPDVPALL